MYNHKRSETWNINSYIQSLQQQGGLSPRDVYWRVWSLANVLKCSECQASFQCSQLRGCPYHPEDMVSSPQSGQIYPCCSQSPTHFFLLPSTQVSSLSMAGPRIHLCYHHTILSTPNTLMYLCTIMINMHPLLCNSMHCLLNPSPSSPL